MGRRSKAELLQIVEKIVTLYSEGNTTRKIAQILGKEGIEISSESVRRTIKASKQIAAQYKVAMEESRVLIEEVRNNSNTDVLETTTSLLASHIFNFVKSLESIEIADTSELIEGLRKLAQAQVQLGKLRLTYHNGVAAAKEALRVAVSRELTGHPKLLEQLHTIIDTVRVKDEQR